MSELKLTPEQNSKAGYIGGITIILLTLCVNYFSPDSFRHPVILIALLITTFTFMLAAELLSQSSLNKKGLFGEQPCAISKSIKQTVKSTLFRYVTLITPWLLMNFFIQFHYYFQSSSFEFTRLAFSMITWVILIVGLPYIYITLRFRGHQKYEYNDYAILMMLLIKSIYLMITQKAGKHIYQNRRIQKVCLAWLVTFFFLPLMLMVYNIEFSAFHANLNSMQSIWFDSATLYQRYDITYQLLFHLIFIVDSSLGIIAYAVSSRWLDNRVRSVDSTMSGWFVALLCYPPMNSAFTSQFIGYNYFPTHPIINSEVAQMIIWAIILFLFTAYVWATAALGFKFSNLCNRGIISSGPYKYFRHPAYTCKNIAWWFENSHVLSSLPASLALLAGNIIYILRGLTEERHLKQDPRYREYCQKVKGKFFFQSHLK